MPLARLGQPGHEIPVLHTIDATYDLRSITADLTGSFFDAGGIDLARIAASVGDLPELADAASLRIGAPIATPGKIVCIGLNYRDHAAETGAALPEEPVVFMKDPSTIGGPFDRVMIPRGSTKTDWEVELGIVIGHTARYLDSPDAAAEVIAGYVLSNDVSEREFQLERGGTWDKGKSCETFNPLGPVLVPADEVGDPQSLRLRTWVNGELRQDGSTSSMVFGIHHIVWYLSQFMVLRPGDLINTGTPAGVAGGHPGKPYLRDGDVVELEVERLGRARQRYDQA